ncbi:hypothetical protein B1B_01259 [mine drainage metagenome]|uniref:5' nucleotidase, deoxy (Pyrimidine), cytosolic type C protein (NT5C) n=1 Tax=mine drainage metagenome TaxID=410659 RepID=T1C538_9ZZZZ
MHKIAVDVDGVLLDFDGAWKLHAELALHRRLARVSGAYDLGDRYGLSGDEVAAGWQKFHELHGWGGCATLPGAVEAVMAQISTGAEIHVISAMNPRAIDWRIRRLRELGISGTLHVPPRKARSVYVNWDKGPLLRQIRPAFYADDQWPHCRAAREAGVPFVAHIHADHDGHGEPVAGVTEYGSLAEALAAFGAERTAGEIRPRKTA